MSERLRLRQSGLGWQTLDGEVVALDSPRGVYLGANESGSVLWEALSEGATREQLVQALLDAYGVERATAEHDADAFIAEVREQGLLDTEGE
jgi:hypothetical protein